MAYNYAFPISGDSSALYIGGGVSAGVNSLTKPGTCKLKSRVLRSFDIAGLMTKEFTPVVGCIPLLNILRHASPKGLEYPLAVLNPPGILLV